MLIKTQKQTKINETSYSNVYVSKYSPLKWSCIAARLRKYLRIF